MCEDVLVRFMLFRSFIEAAQKIIIPSLLNEHKSNGMSSKIAIKKGKWL